MSILDLNFTLTEECLLLVGGYIELHKTIDNCKINYATLKKGMTVSFKGQRDFCELLKKFTMEPLAALYLHANGINTLCPVDPFNLTYGEAETMDVSSLKRTFRLFSGKYNGKFTVECDNGAFGYEYEIELKWAG
ncbi:hypothetical protein C0J52_18670 [Blattella germanica]|nr:hypothetical protein C0J52_18670 [Blattella germanica]